MPNCTNDTGNNDIKIKRETGNLNSSLPLFMKYICMLKANTPPSANTRENHKPATDCQYTSTNPNSTINRIIKCNTRKNEIPPGSLNSFHSFQ